MIPKTYLLTAPGGSGNKHGTGMLSSKMIAGLKKLNPTIWVEADYCGYPDGVWYPGRYTGLTCLWFGRPGNKDGSKKISGFVPGIIPEFTILNEKGMVETLGWRRILEKAIKFKAVRRAAVEKLFGVTLDIQDGHPDLWCRDCMRKGKQVKATSANNLCDMHSRIVKNVSKANDFKSDLKWLRRNEEPCTPKLTQ